MTFEDAGQIRKTSSQQPCARQDVSGLPRSDRLRLERSDIEPAQLRPGHASLVDLERGAGLSRIERGLFAPIAIVGVLPGLFVCSGPSRGSLVDTTSGQGKNGPLGAGPTPLCVIKLPAPHRDQRPTILALAGDRRRGGGSRLARAAAARGLSGILCAGPG